MKLNRLFLGTLLAAATSFAHAEISFTPSLTYTNPDNYKASDSNYGYDLALGWLFTPAFAVELNYANTDSKLNNSPYHTSNYNGSSTYDSRYGLNAYYAFNAEGKLSPYFLLGGGWASYTTDAPYYKASPPALSAYDHNNTQNFNSWYTNAGVGLFYHFTKSVALRAEYRFVFSNPGGDSLYDNVGLIGIQLATDSTPAPAPVVAPPVHEAPPVPVDSDGDGVPDDRDQCPNTPAGVKVDSVGCPLDSDKDGVPDYLDKCPDTPAGVVVDENGCPKVLTETITKQLNITFDTGKSNIKEEFRPAIGDVATLLKQYPTSVVEIQGHTDSTGSKRTNEKLSQARADAVKDVLVQYFAIDASRITAKGYGSSQPVASNKTAEGRAKNRRVMALVSGEVKKVQMKPTATKAHHHRATNKQ